VQILVVVANIQARTLKANVEKGFLGTAFGQELVDPKTLTNLMKWTTQPQINQDYPVNLSILITGGKETNKDVCK